MLCQSRRVGFVGSAHGETFARDTETFFETGEIRRLFQQPVSRVEVHCMLIAVQKFTPQRAEWSN